MNDLQQTLETLIGSVVKSTPELDELRAKVVRGELSEEAALQQMVEVVCKDPEIYALIEAHRPAATSRLPRLDPLVEATLAERAQFDKDMPELRSGPLLPGVAPAVAVALTARNPVAGGVMLQQASTEMQSRIAEHEASRLQLVEAAIQKALPGMTTAAEALLKIEDPEFVSLVAGSAATDLPEYRRGQLPAPVSLTAPSGSALAALTPEQSRGAAWSLLSTTQGRRSANSVIEKLIVQDLQKHGLVVHCRNAAESDTPPLAYHEWIVTLSQGPAATQSAFSFIDMAAKVLSTGLRKKAGLAKNCILETSPINRISDREVGWAARLFAVN